MRSRTGLIVILGILSAMGGRAHAASPEAEKQARRSFDRAEAHFKAGAFAEALTEYQEGYARLPLPGFLINIAQCQRRLGDLEQARATYRRFILVAPDSPYVPEVKTLVAELDKLLDAPAAPSPKPPAPPEAAEEPSPVAGAIPEPGDAPRTEAVASSNLVSVPADSGPPRAVTTTRWWLWGTIAGAVVAGAVLGVVLLRSPETTTLHDGSIGTLRR
jgi:hypothetical protein